MNPSRGLPATFRKTKPKAIPEILFVSSGAAPDYQCDMMFHGLKKLYGRHVSSSNTMWYMFNDISEAARSSLYGRGFTVYGDLDTSLGNHLEPADIQRKLKKKFFDKVIYGSIHRDQRYLEDVASHYDSSDIIFIDGEDETIVLEHYKSLGRYFKRELLDTEVGVSPIQFCLPSEKIAPAFPHKVKTWATTEPGKAETYIFTEEHKYYLDYQQSLYGRTQKRAGWDCLRHYEIMANWCIPWFAGLDECPQRTMFRFPREVVSAANREVYDAKQAEQCARYLVEHVRTHLTTEAMARYLLED